MAASPFEVLQKVPLLASIPSAELAPLAQLTRERRYAKGSMILMQGEPGDALYLIADGQVKVVLVGEDGREVILSVLGPGSFFGEMSLLDDEPRSAHVVAMSETLLLQLRREDFQARLRNSPEVAIGLMRELSRRLRRADDTIGSLALRDVHGRIAHLLLAMAEEEDGRQITRRLTHATLAQMIGASRETVSRAMRTLVTTGVIKVSRKDITLLQPDALRAIVDRG